MTAIEDAFALMVRLACAVSAPVALLAVWCAGVVLGGAFGALAMTLFGPGARRDGARRTGDGA